MNQTKLAARTMTLALAATLGACAAYMQTDGGYVEAQALYPTRVHYYEPAETGIVYFYDTPNVIVKRHYYRENDGRSYYYEHDRRGDRRIYYDYERAAHGHGPEHEHGHGHDEHR